jgi:hypothetical protein
MDGGGVEGWARWWDSKRKVGIFESGEINK